MSWNFSVTTTSIAHKERFTFAFMQFKDPVEIFFFFFALFINRYFISISLIFVCPNF